MNLVAIFVAGLFTFASPCVLPLVPIHLSVLAGASVADLKQGRRSAHALWASLAFSAGLGVVFVGLGLAVTAAGRGLVEHRLLLLQLGGLAVFLFGLKFLGYLRVPWLERDLRPMMAGLGARGGLLGGFLFGAAFGLGWTPCVGPILGSVLTYAATANADAASGALYLATYAAGLAVPLVATAALAPLALRWQQKLLAHVRRLEVATGVLLVLFGLLLMTDHLEALAPSWMATPARPITAAPSSLAETPGGAVTEHGPALALADSPKKLADNPEKEEQENAAVCDSAGARNTGCALPDIIPGDTSSAESAVVGPSGTPRLVEFLSRSCPICQRMEPVLRAAESGCAGHGVKFVRLEIGDPSGRRAADELHVRGVPTFIMLDAGGNEVVRLVGEVPIAVLKQSLEVLAGTKCDNFRVVPPPQ
jgi:cytochrome c-type biogenesis protein